MVCLDLNGKEVWKSGPEHRFGLGPYLIADGLIYMLDDSVLLTWPKHRRKAMNNSPRRKSSKATTPGRRWRWSAEG